LLNHCIFSGTDANATENIKQYASLDYCIDDSYAAALFSIASLVRDHKKPKWAKVEHLRPMAYV